jgi:hypothetical protein
MGVKEATQMQKAWAIIGIVFMLSEAVGAEQVASNSRIIRARQSRNLIVRFAETTERIVY